MGFGEPDAEGSVITVDNQVRVRVRFRFRFRDQVRVSVRVRVRISSGSLMKLGTSSRWIIENLKGSS